MQFFNKRITLNYSSGGKVKNRLYIHGVPNEDQPQNQPFYLLIKLESKPHVGTTILLNPPLSKVNPKLMNIDQVKRIICQDPFGASQLGLIDSSIQSTTFMDKIKPFELGIKLNSSIDWLSFDETLESLNIEPGDALLVRTIEEQDRNQSIGEDRFRALQERLNEIHRS